MFDPKLLKNDFPIFTNDPKLVYLDTAATSQTPQVVLDAMNEYYTGYRSNVHRGVYKQATLATVRYEEARKTVARFIGADASEIVFTPSATASINLLLYALEQKGMIKAGDNLATSVLEHHSVVVPLQELAKRTKATISYIPLYETMLDYRVAKQLIKENTKIIVVSLASNVLGTINYVRLLADEVHKHGGIIIVDATAAVGHTPLDVKELGADFLVFSGHKMCGPTGIGVLYGTQKLLKELPPSFFGGGIVKEVTKEKSEFRDVPHSLEAGTQNIAGVIGLGAAVGYLEKIGVSAIKEHVGDLMVYAFSQLCGFPGVSLFAHESTRENIGIISFAQKGIHPHDTAEILSRRGIAVRAGHHCAQPLMQELKVPSTVRASFYLYNTREDVDALVEGLKEAQNVFNK